VRGSPNELLAALIALAAAASWGGGDFSGGMGVKAAGGSARAALRFVLLAHAISLLVLVGVLLARREPLVWGAPMAWALAGGVCGGLGLAAFYVALSRGAMGSSAAVSGLLAAAIPALVSIGIEGRPGALRLGGFALAMAAIWLIAAGPREARPEGGGVKLALAVVAGVAFGLFFVALRLANPLGVVLPMALARAGSLAACALLLVVLVVTGRVSGAVGTQIPLRQAQANDKSSVVLGWALGVALLDTGGNMLFLAATRVGRLDVAAVLSSLYPASTILLAAWLLHERPTARQLAGMGVALAAVAMITL